MCKRDTRLVILKHSTPLAGNTGVKKNSLYINDIQARVFIVNSTFFEIQRV